MDRRSVLGAVGTLGVTSLSGCLGFFQKDSPPATTVGRISIINHDPDSSHEIALRLERDDEVVHTSSHTVPKKDGRSVGGTVPDCTWETKPGEYVVSANADGGEWVHRNVTTISGGKSPDCVTVSVDYGKSAGKESYVDPDDPLYIIATDWCDRIRRYNGGCPEYQN